MCSLHVLVFVGRSRFFWHLRRLTAEPTRGCVEFQPRLRLHRGLMLHAETVPHHRRRPDAKHVRHLQHGFLIATKEVMSHQSANATYAGHVSTSCAGVPQCEEWAATSPCARPSTRQSVQGWILNPEPSFLRGHTCRICLV